MIRLFTFLFTQGHSSYKQAFIDLNNTYNNPKPTNQCKQKKKKRDFTFQSPLNTQSPISQLHCTTNLLPYNELERPSAELVCVYILTKSGSNEIKS